MSFPEHSDMATKVKIAASTTFGKIPISTLQRGMLPICNDNSVCMDVHAGFVSRLQYPF